MGLSNSIVKVMVVDDSALIRALLKEIFDSDKRFELVAVAKDAFEARDLIKKCNPDVLTLDIEMPKMNGITFLKNLMRLRPMPVVMISTLTQEGAPSTLEALELGAVDFVPKPKNEGGVGLAEYRDTIVEKVLNAARAKVRPFLEGGASTNIKQTARSNASSVKSKRLKPRFICAIGASTGGTEAIKEVITSLPENSPPIVVVQHIPESFSKSYAARVDGLAAVNVYEAEDNQKIERGCVYIAPGSMHMRIALTATGYYCKLDGSELVNRHRPSVEVLFDSVTEVAKQNAMGVLLTGMGNDGSEALLRMKQAGCLTVIQDEATSVVWGMPGAAAKMGAAVKEMALDKVAKEILSAAYK